MTRGFTTGAATHIFSAQMKNVFGIKLNQYSGAGKLLFVSICFFVSMHSLAYQLINQFINYKLVTEHLQRIICGK
jgi:MFS superfamily sulfate permease-like transporter